MLNTEWIGSAAATMTTTAFVPQVWQVWRTRSAQDISFGMYAIFTAGVACWLAYGLLLNAWPIIVANGITLLLASSILTMKWRYG